MTLGEFGVIHPDVLRNFGIQDPVTALEINIEPMCVDQYGNNLMKNWA